MCQHTTPANLKRMIVDDEARDVGELLRLSETYDMYSAAVYGALLRVMLCEDCASAVLVRTFRTLRVPEQENPKLHRLLRDAFGCSFEAASAADRAVLKERIMGWFMQGRVASGRAAPSTPSGSSTWLS